MLSLSAAMMIPMSMLTCFPQDAPTKHRQLNSDEFEEKQRRLMDRQRKKAQQLGEQELTANGPFKQQQLGFVPPRAAQLIVSQSAPSEATSKDTSGIRYPQEAAMAGGAGGASLRASANSGEQEADVVVVEDEPETPAHQTNSLLLVHGSL